MIIGLEYPKAPMNMQATHKYGGRSVPRLHVVDGKKPVGINAPNLRMTPYTEDSFL